MLRFRHARAAETAETAGVGLESGNKNFAKILQIALNHDKSLSPSASLAPRPNRVGPAGKTGDRGVLATADILLFEGFRLDRQGDGLSRRNERGVFVPVPIGLRALDVLAVLVGRSGDLVTKEEIMAAVWGRTIVENANLTVQISALRRILDAGRNEGSCIQTVAARGYRFVAPVTRVKHATPVPTAGLTPKEPGSASVSPRLAVVVLPFANLSDDPERGYFADGITDDLTTDLSWTPEFFVISRSTAFAYKGKSVETRQMGCELGVDYVVEGSLRATGSHLQVNAQLIDAESGAHVWADRFETDGNDMSAAEGEITGRLSWDLRRNLFAAVSRRAERDSRSDGNAKTIAIRGWSVYHRPRSAANMQEALQLWERALDIDPGSMSAKIGIALALVSNFWYGWSCSFQHDKARAERLLLDVLALDPSDITARIVMGILRRLQGRLTESKIELESVPALDRNVAGLRQLGATLVYLGQPEAAIRPLERSIRLSPYEANIGFNYTYVGLCHLLLGRVDKAIDHLRMARTSNPRVYIPHFYSAAALALSGDLDEARTALAEGIKLKPEVNSLAAWQIYRPWETNPEYLALRAKTLDVGLHRAGFPVEVTPH
jgi:TolB-like protein